jgi:osmotically-inducible protein OsmY
MIADSLRRLKRRFRSSPQSRDERQTLKDKLLARRLRDTFERDMNRADLQGLHFYVQDGVVTLYGTVRHHLDRDLLMRLVREVPGVKAVVAEKLQIVDGRFRTDRLAA